MSRRKKLWLIIIQSIAGLLLGISLYTFTYPPGLQYLLVLYDSILIMILGGVSYFIIRKIRYGLLIPIIISLAGLITAIPALSASSISGLILTSIGLFGILICIVVTWKTGI
jgi:hypothetical protein